MKKTKIFLVAIVMLLLSFFVPIRTEYVTTKTSYKEYYNIYGIKICSIITDI